MILTFIVGFSIPNLLLKIKIKKTICNVQHDQQPRNLRKLREAIISACESLDQGMIQNAFDGMISTARRCIQAQGHAFPDE